MRHLFKDTSTNYPFWILLLILILQRIVVLIEFNGQCTDNDQTLTWIIAKDYSEGNFHQPFMYGQNYGYMIEALLAVPLLWCKVPVEWALPIVTNFLAIIPFVSFAFAYRNKGQHAAAVVLLAIPLLLPVSYALITSMPRGFINGLAFFALWPWIERIKRAPLRFALYGFVLAAAFVTNSNVIFIMVLLGGLAFFEAEKKMPFVMFTLVGASIPALLHLWAKVWVDNHPSDIIHRAWGLEWTSDYFMQALTQTPFAFFRGVVPFTEDYAHIAWFVFPVICFYAFWKKKYPQAVLVALICAGVIASLGINKVNDGVFNIFFPQSRMFLALPLVLALVVAGLVNETRARTVAFVLMIAGGIFAGIQIMQVKPVIMTEVYTKENVPVQMETMQGLKFKTDQLHSFALSNSIRHFAGAGYPMKYGEQQNLFHAGECWYNDFPSCAIPEYERRAWRRREILDAPANTTGWLGGMDQQWQHVDTAVGKVDVMDVTDLRVYRVNSAEKNETVFRALRSANGLLE